MILRLKVGNHMALHVLWVALCWLTFTATGLASAQGSADETVEVRKILHQAREAAAGSQKECYLPKEIVRALVKAGDLEGAMQTAAAIQDGVQDNWCMQSVFREIIEILVDVRQALQIATGIQDDRAKTYALLAIVESQAEAGHVQVAAGAALGIPDGTKWKPMALAQVAEAQAKAGDRTGALKIIERALQAVARLPEDSQKASALQDIARVQETARDRAGAAKTVEQALQAAGNVRSDHEKANAVTCVSPIAEAQVKGGDRAGALKTVEQALQVVTTIRSEIPAKARALSVFASIQAKAGDRDGAAKTFKQALQTATLIQESEKGKDSVLSHIAVGLAAAGDIQGAVQTAAGILGEKEKGGAVKAITRAQAKSGDLRGAHVLAAGQSSSFVKANALLGVAEGILERRDAEKPQITWLSPEGRAVLWLQCLSTQRSVCVAQSDLSRSDAGPTIPTMVQVQRLVQNPTGQIRN